jgi:hypothetical protein
MLCGFAGAAPPSMAHFLLDVTMGPARAWAPVGALPRGEKLAIHSAGSEQCSQFELPLQPDGSFRMKLCYRCFVHTC